MDKRAKWTFARRDAGTLRVATSNIHRLLTCTTGHVSTPDWSVVPGLLTCVVPRVTISRSANVHRATCHYPAVPTIAIAMCATCHPTCRHIIRHVSKSMSQLSAVSRHVRRSKSQLATSSSANESVTRVATCHNPTVPTIAFTTGRHVSAMSA